MADKKDIKDIKAKLKHAQKNLKKAIKMAYREKNIFDVLLKLDNATHNFEIELYYLNKEIHSILMEFDDFPIITL